MGGQRKAEEVDAAEGAMLGRLRTSPALTRWRVCMDAVLASPISTEW